MTLTDAGPLIALLDRNDQAHASCRAALAGLDAPMVTTWPTFTEAMYLLGARAGWPAQERLWRLAARGDLRLARLEDEQLESAQRLMEQYRDQPMDLADATLVAYAESTRMHRVFTLDAEFTIYRIHGHNGFEIVPPLG